MTAQPFSLERLTPLDYGWTLSSNFQTVKWFDGEQVPDVIGKITEMSTEMIVMLKIVTLMIQM